MISGYVREYPLLSLHIRDLTTSLDSLFVVLFALISLARLPACLPPACHTAVYSMMQTIQRQGNHKSATNSGECPICRKLWLSSCYGKSTLHFTAYPLHCVLPVTCKVPSQLISEQTIHLAHT